MHRYHFEHISNAWSLPAQSRNKATPYPTLGGVTTRRTEFLAKPDRHRPAIPTHGKTPSRWDIATECESLYPVKFFGGPVVRRKVGQRSDCFFATRLWIDTDGSIFGQNFTIRDRTQSTPCCQIDGVRDEADGAVGEQQHDAAGVPASTALDGGGA